MITYARILPFCIGFGFVTTFGCGSPMGAWEGEEVGQVGISLSSVPSDGTCLRFTTTAGTRSFQQTFDAVADSPLTAALHGLPYNQSLSIFAEAFAGSCSALGTSSLATYLSDVQTTILAPGETKGLTFTLRPTGNVNGSAEFLFLTITPTSKAFGNVVVGQQSSPFSFSVANIGMIPTSPLSASILDFTGSTDQFTISSNTCNGPLPSGQTCSVQVSLTPTTNGSKSGMLRVTGMTGGTVNATLSGTGWNPAHLTMTPAMANYGNVPIGTLARLSDFVVVNTGDEPTSAPVITLEPSGMDFTAFNTCTATLVGRGSCRVSVFFLPTSTGTKSATLNVTSMPAGTVSAALSGTGISPLTLSPTSADLGSAPVGSRGATQTFTLRNTSQQATTALTVSSSTSDFSITADGCSTRTLAANATCTVTVQLSPTTTGPVSGTLDASASPGWSAQAPLTGSGT